MKINLFPLRLNELLVCVPERNMQRVLLIGPPVVFEPTCHVPPFRVVVRPVDHTSFFVPHVLAVEAYAIAFLWPGDPRCDVDVVRNKDRLT